MKLFFKNLLRRAFGQAPVVPGELNLRELPALLKTKTPTILEIGCNDGMHTERFLELFPQARIYCFEPDPRARRRFEAKITSDRVQLFDCAIGAEDGEAAFYASGGWHGEATPETMPEGWDHSGSIRPPKGHLDRVPWVTFESTFTTQVRRLDSWASEHAIDRVDFIWADVQGAEIDLIQGGSRTLAATRFFYTEYSNREMYEGQAKLSTLLSNLPDFEVVTRFEGDVLLSNRNRARLPHAA